MIWHFVEWSGDFRLESVNEKSCTLTVCDPTPSELERLGTFLSKARSKGWIEQHVGLAGDMKKIVINVAAPLSKAGKILLGKRTKGLLTAVVSKAGKVEAEIEGDASRALALVEKKEATAATTVRRPTLCCPLPQPGPDVRATEVLHTFCSPSQRVEYDSKGLLHCYGGLSGRLYEIAHRHHPRAVERGKIIWDVEGEHVLHAYDWSVPPAEEVLVMKLTLEYAEHWIRNASGNLALVAPTYRNPFMSDETQLADGIGDAAFMRNLGEMLDGFASAFSQRGS